MTESVKTIRLRQATWIVSVGTLLSRITGLLREVALAAVFGASGTMDAFFVAFRIPNTLRRLVGEGGVTVAVQPVYTRRLGDQDGTELAIFERSLWSFMHVLLAVISLAGMVFADALIPLFAAGFEIAGPTYAEAAVLLKILFPFTYFIGLVGLAMGVLNARGWFFGAAVSQAVLNVAVIVAALVPLALIPSGWPPTLWLAIGVIVGAVGDWLWLRHDMRRAGVARGWLWQPRHPGIRETLKLLLPATAGLAVYQLQVIVGTQFASFLPAGGVSCLSYADRLIQFPLGMIGTAIGTVALPLFSRARNQGQSLGPVLGDTLGWAAFLALPATAGLVLLREPIVTLLFERGAFGAEQSARTAAAVAGYSVALIPAALNRILLPAFYADRDMRTPVWTAALALAAQAALSWWWHDRDVLGLAAATAAGSLLQSVALAGVLAARGHRPRGAASSLLRSVAATGAMAAGVAAADHAVAGAAVPLRVLVGMTVGAGVYAAAAMVLRHPEAVRLYTRVAARIVPRR